jgi:Uri superfamily endonuclease
MLDVHGLPSSGGVYVLHLSISRLRLVTIGRLGQQHLPAGHYLYVGSAHGAGGLRARVGRHLRGDGALRWHIDYLRAAVEVQDAFYTVTDKALECQWSQALARLPGAFIPIPHFGSSDCRSGCAAHLVGLPRHADLAGVLQALDQSDCAPIVRLR